MNAPPKYVDAISLHVEALATSPTASQWTPAVSAARTASRGGALLALGVEPRLPWRVALSPDRGSILLWVTAGFGVVYALVLLYLATLFIGAEHRTVYDRLAGSIVIER